MQRRSWNIVFFLVLTAISAIILKNNSFLKEAPTNPSPLIEASKSPSALDKIASEEPKTTESVRTTIDQTVPLEIGEPKLILKHEDFVQLFPERDPALTWIMWEYADLVFHPPMGRVVDYSGKASVIEMWKASGAESVKVLETQLAHPNWGVRVNIALLIGGTDCKQGIDLLLSRLETETEPLVRAAIKTGLAQSGYKTREIAEELHDTYIDREVDPWFVALFLASIHHPDAFPYADAMAKKTDGGLGPMVHGAIELRKAVLRSRNS